MTSTSQQPDRGRPAWQRWALVAVITLIVVLVLVVGTSLALQRSQDGVLTGVSVDGRDAGGATRAELGQLVADRADTRGGEPVVVEGEHEEVRATRAEVGADFDVDATVEDAWSRGRRGVFRSLADHLAARRGQQVDVPLSEGLDEAAARSWAEDAAEELSVEAVDAELSFDDSDDPEGDGDAPRVVVTDATAGERVDGAAMADELVERLRQESGAVRVSAPGEPVEADITDEEVAAIRPDAEEAVSEGIILRNPGGGEDVELSAAQLAGVLRVSSDHDAPEGERLAIVADDERLAEHIDPEEVDTEPTEATFAVDGDDVEIDGGEAGFAVDVEATAADLVEVATSDDREGELAGDTTEPDLTREDAEELGIEEEVASFTTEHAPGEPRVHNIQLLADILEGSVILPGETFSINDEGGPRTEERGFLADGVIIDGELEDQVGGGVSQYATTFFNAAWFAGVQILEHQPHSFYIARYPEGRESTLAFGSIDVVIENDSPYGILVSHEYSETSITVRFFSSPWAEVDSWTSDRRDVMPGEVTDGFTVDYGRTITYPEGDPHEESYTWTYEPNDDG